MLALKMNTNDRLKIGDDVELTFVRTSYRNRIEVFVNAPRELKIERIASETEEKKEKHS